MKVETTARRVDVIDPLRALAALAVAWFHFTHGSPTFLPNGWLKSSGTYGWMGVEVFFVISGFVLPFSMHAGRYRLQRHWLTFFKKRLTRLEPPYIASILLTLSLLFLSARVPGFAGQQPQLRISDLLFHVAYLNAFTGGNWLNPVYWTLAVEFQFYLTISLVFPLVVNASAKKRHSLVACLALLALTSTNPAYVLMYLDLFAIGIATFQHFVGFSTRRQYVVTLLLLGALSGWIHGALIALVCVGTSLVISFVRWRPPRALVKLGAVSYSIYLLHVPIGGRVINLGLRLPYSLAVRIAFLLIALAASIAAALFFGRFIEGPAQRWSASIKYRSPRSKESESRPSVAFPGSPETEPSM